MTLPKPNRFLPALLLGLLTPCLLEAHLMNSGFGPFYDGLVHPFLGPGDLLPVLALALLAGQRGAAAGRRLLLTLPTAWCGGLLLAWVLPGALIPAWGVGLLVLLLGVLVAGDWAGLERRIPWLALPTGFLLGQGNGVELLALEGGGLALLGILSCVLLLLFLVTGQVASLAAAHPPLAQGCPTPRLVLRVAGSWIAAIGLLMLGWALRPV